MFGSKKQKAVENRAMAVATKHYAALGYSVTDTSTNNRYDLLCSKDDETVRVKVKGLTGGLGVVEVTKGEVQSARSSECPTHLFVVYSISLKEINRTDFVGEGGESHILASWQPKDSDLDATRFRFTVARPVNNSGPFFAYGIFKPGQLAFRQLEKFVARTDETATVRGKLLERDGLPIVELGGNNSVHGALIDFHSGKEADAFEAIDSLEPSNQYYWGKTDVHTSSGIRNALLLIGRKPDKGSTVLESNNWDGSNDPLFESALDVVEETLSRFSKFECDLKPLFRLEMAYLLLWSAIERFASFSYNLGSNPWQKVKQFANEPAFVEALAKEVSEVRHLFRADQAGRRVELIRTNPKKSIEYYYQVRSNITHRGKGVRADHQHLQSSTGELLAIFRAVLEDTFPKRSVKRED